MIDVRIIAKKKAQSTGSGGAGKSGGMNYGSTATDSTHAAKADRAAYADEAGMAASATTAAEATHAASAGALDENSPTREDFLSAKDDDEAAGLITFEKGLNVGDKTHGIDESGNATLNDVEAANISGQTATVETTATEEIKNAAATVADRALVGGKGFDMYVDEAGKSHLWVDELDVRLKAYFASLEIRKVSYSGGTTIFSNAGSTIVKVAEVSNDAGAVVAYKCYAKADDGTTATQNWWKVGMQALCKTFNIKAGQYDGVQNRYYWRLVVGVGQETMEDGLTYDYVVLSNLETFGARQNTNIPVFGESALADGTTALAWGDSGVLSITAQEWSTYYNIVKDLYGEDEAKALPTVITGYDTTGTDAPQPYDVIVQVGDQLHPAQYGNLVKIATSAEDSDPSGTNAPSFEMYHAMSGFKWETRTALISPGETVFYSEYFKISTKADGSDAQTVPSMIGTSVTDAKTELQSEITQTAEEIRSTVSKTTERITQSSKAGRNLLPHSMYHLISSRYGQGENVAQNVYLEKGKTYTLMVRGYIDAALKNVTGGMLVCFVYDDAWSWSKTLMIDSLTPVTKAVTWEHTSDSGYTKVNFYPLHTAAESGELDGEPGHIFVEWAALEEADADTASMQWSAHENDVPMGNLLPELDASGTGWSAVNGTIGEAKPDGAITLNAVSIDNIGGATDVDILAMYGLSVQSGCVYCLSMWAKGSGEIATTLYNDDYTQCYGSVTSEGSVVASPAGANITLTSEWRRVWVVFTVQTTNSDARLLVARVPAGSSASVCGMKLEAQGMATEYGTSLVPLKTELQSEIKQTAESISLSVTEVKTIADNAQASADNAQSSAEAAQTSADNAQSNLDGTITQIKKTGIDIETGKITLDADTVEVKNGDETAAMFEDGALNADLINVDHLSTVGTDAHIEIHDGIMEVFGTLARNIKFGIDENGYAVLSYYNNNGQLLYDLGPNGIDTKNARSESFEEIECVLASTIAGTTAFYGEVSYLVGTEEYYLNKVTRAYQSAFFGSPITMGYKPAAKYSKIRLYRYTAGKIGGAYMTSASKGLTTSALAEEADGKVFTSNSVLAKDGALTNLASGIYVPTSASVGAALSPYPEQGTTQWRWPKYSVAGLKNITAGVSEKFILYSWDDTTYTPTADIEATALTD